MCLCIYKYRCTNGRKSCQSCHAPGAREQPWVPLFWMPMHKLCQAPRTAVPNTALPNHQHLQTQPPAGLHSKTNVTARCHACREASQHHSATLLPLPFSSCYLGGETKAEEISFSFPSGMEICPLIANMISKLHRISLSTQITSKRVVCLGLV